ncbi:MAG TPA: c-type cytochrome [Edaphobacter sp.]|nr:c-type cytochrome [Edaphobacter sp.]
MATLLFVQAQTSAVQAASAQEKPATSSAHADAGAKTFSTYCSGCHGADGRGGERAPNIATTRNIVAMSDDDLVAIVTKGVSGSGMPAFGFLGDPAIKDVIAHLRDLQGKNSTVKISGDPKAGQALFFGQAGCSQCHMVKGEGGFIATDLTDYANGIAPDVIATAITKPDAVLAPTSTVVEAVLPNGQQVSGLARAEDNFTITLQTTDGRWHTFEKSKLKDLKYTDHSIHPRDYASRLSSKELDDLVSYLTASAANAPAKPSRRRNH